MESAPITLGYDYARAASVATQNSEIKLAISQHALAAGEFSKAASSTKNTEALRTLQLLEQHHQRLSDLLQSATESPATVIAEQEGQTARSKQQTSLVVVSELKAKILETGASSLSTFRAAPSLRQSRRLPHRELSSSIASNLATARGIRTNYAREPLSPTITINQAPGNLEALPRRQGKRCSVPTISEYPSKNQNTSASNSTNSPLRSELISSNRLSGNEEGFSRFYSTFENILSKLSAPLAFAGLPLVTEETVVSIGSYETKTNGEILTPIREQITTQEFNLTKHFSQAALRASTRDDYSANDSFYVVPSTRNPISYAHILSFDQKEKRRMAVSMNSDNQDSLTDLHDDDNFLYTRETPVPFTPYNKHNSSKVLSSREKDNKIEELTMENGSLKTAVDKLSKRLHTFEVSAQVNSIALAESMRLMRDFSPSRKKLVNRTESENYREDKLLKQRIQELEEYLRVEVKENEHLKKDNEKLRGVVTRYRERWEKLKEGAKSRREGKDGATVDILSNTQVTKKQNFS
ncbi:hypothetical protein GcM3_132019 [Golovinomyces cichoracearum]|uniref:Uncharacterized protein n=1 Tax=Golovinomyces cichoracearum TaxID=62708 RepID=A0A420I425_9PEZI|nr:hypothetical protein GcM3_132019 [Golovinomyces cichoracearum]